MTKMQQYETCSYNIPGRQMLVGDGYSGTGTTPHYNYYYKPVQNSHGCSGAEDERQENYEPFGCLSQCCGDRIQDECRNKTKRIMPIKRGVDRVYGNAVIDQSSDQYMQPSTVYTPVGGDSGIQKFSTYTRVPQTESTRIPYSTYTQDPTVYPSNVYYSTVGQHAPPHTYIVSSSETQPQSKYKTETFISDAPPTRDVSPCFDEKVSPSTPNLKEKEILMKRLEEQKELEKMKQKRKEEKEKKKKKSEIECDAAKELFETKQELKNVLNDLYAKDSLIENLKGKYPDDADLQDAAIVKGISDKIKYLNDDNDQLHRCVDALHSEKKQLEQMLLQRDKEISCYANLGGEARDISAMQLGVEAISMVQTNAELKEKLRILEADIKSLRLQKENYFEQNNDLENKLNEKQNDIGKLNECIAAKEMRIAGLESILHQKDAEMLNFKDESREQINRKNEEINKRDAEIAVQIENNEKLRNEICSKNSEILSLQEEFIRKNQLIKDLENKEKKLNADLTDAHTDLQRLVDSFVVKDKYLCELEQQLKNNEIKRQASYLAEMSKSRKVQMEVRFKEEEYKNNIRIKEDQIVKLLKENESRKKQIEKLRAAFNKAFSYQPFEAPPIISSASGVSSSSSLSSTINAPISSVQWSGSCSDEYKPKTVIRESLSSPPVVYQQVVHTLPQTATVTQDMNVPQSYSSSISAPPVPQVQIHPSQLDPSIIPPQHTTTTTYLKLQRKSDTARQSLIDSIFTQDYIPVDGDLVDQRLANYLNNAKYYKKKFVRINKEDYIYAEKKRIKLRISVDGSLQGQIEPDKSQWIDFEKFLLKIEEFVAAMPDKR